MMPWNMSVGNCKLSFELQGFRYYKSVRYKKHARIMNSPTRAYTSLFDLATDILDPKGLQSTHEPLKR